MASSLDSVTAATKLRRDTMEVQKELDDKRSDYQRRMDHVTEDEEQLKVERGKLQETLVLYYKYIQDNEIKRNRANKKAAAEERVKQERFGQIKDLRHHMEDLEREKNYSRQQYLQLVKYQKYLEEVLQFGDQEEYQDPKDIIKRFEILDDNTKVLQRRKTQLEEDLGKNKVSLTAKKAKKKNESVDLQNQLSELQNNLEGLQKEYKQMQDELDSQINHKGGTTKTIGQVRMACQNLYDRCVEWNTAYRSRAQHDHSDSDVIHQLVVIGDCLEDYSYIIKKHGEKTKGDNKQQPPVPAGGNTSTVLQTTA